MINLNIEELELIIEALTDYEYNLANADMEETDRKKLERNVCDLHGKMLKTFLEKVGENL